MEKLNKSQIVLLTLLVSFVTSIATGIVTVSLMQQAPPNVAQTINQVIEHTIETVVATSTKQVAAAATLVQQKTVVVDDSQLIAEAVKRVQPSVVRIYASDDQSLIGLGIVINGSGTVVSDESAFGDRPDATLILQDGTTVHAFVTTRDSGSGLLYLTPATSTSATLTWAPAAVTADVPRLGESIVVLSGAKTPQISAGLVRSLPLWGNSTTTKMVDTTIDASSVLPGAPLFDTDGTIIGVSTGLAQASASSGFTPASLISLSGTRQK